MKMHAFEILDSISPFKYLALSLSPVPRTVFPMNTRLYANLRTDTYWYYGFRAMASLSGVFYIQAPSDELTNHKSHLAMHRL
jgi:hypothetical protein